MQSIITIGNFDGVHLGHRAILQEACRLAGERGAQVLALTFDPMPVAVLRPGSEPPQVMSIEQRIAALKQGGADRVEVVEPTADVLSQDATRFIAGLLERYQAVGFVEGEDFRFGSQRKGDMALLAQLGQQRGFAVSVMPRVEARLSDQSVAPISSSLIRWLVGRGRVEDAERCMGRPYALSGTVVRGDQRGRTIGVPTINLDPAAHAGLILPMDGVYAGFAQLDENQQPVPAAISVGVKPTFGKDTLTVEAHLVDVTTDEPDALYGHRATIHFARWLRDQYPFPGIDPLKAQLARDIDAARSLFTAQP